TEAPFERGLAHRIVDHVHAPPVRQLPDPLREVLARVQDHLVRARAPRELGLRLGGHRPQHPRAPHLRHLHQQQPDPAGRRVHQRHVPLPQRIRVVGQVVRRHPLQHDRGRHIARHARRNRDQCPRRNHRVLRVRSGRRRVRHPITGPETLHARPHRLHHPARLLPRREGERHRVQPRAVVHVDVVHPRRLHPHQHLPLPDLRNPYLLHSQDLRATMSPDHDRLHRTTSRPISAGLSSSSTFARAGSSTVNTLPTPGSLLTRTSPPNKRHRPRTTVNPRPVPASGGAPGGCACRNGSKIFSRASDAIPTPVSLTSTRIIPTSTQPRNRTRPRSVNFTAFESRFTTICRSLARSETLGTGSDGASTSSTGDLLAANGWIIPTASERTCRRASGSTRTTSRFASIRENVWIPSISSDRCHALAATRPRYSRCCAFTYPARPESRSSV